MDYTKKLAVFDPCTHFEHNKGHLQQLLENYLHKSPSKNFKFDWFFCFNRGPTSNYEDLLVYEGHPNINKIYLIDEKIPEDQDVYIRQHNIEFINTKIQYSEVPKPENLPDLGGASGPNLGFYLAIDILLRNYDHDYFFMVEHDSLPVKDLWFDYMHEYIDREDFLIAGSKYKGHQKWHYVLNYKDHLNGIAIYKNDKMLLDFVNQCKIYNRRAINDSDWCINFDILLDQFYKTNQGKNLVNHKTPFINTDFITNISDPNDYHLTQSQVINNHPNTIIIHQKEYKKLESFRQRYQENEFEGLLSSTKHEDSCMFFLRQPRTAGNWLLKSITSTLSLRDNKIKMRYPIPYFIKIKFPSSIDNQFITCDFFLLSSRLFEGLKRGFGQAALEISAEDFKDLYKEVKQYIRPILISNDPFDHQNNIRQIFDFFVAQDFFNYNLDCYAILREPFDKTKSLYTEKINSKSSSKDSFIEFLNSSSLPDSFIIRSLSNVSRHEEIEFFHYEEAVRILKQFNCFDISETKEMLIYSFTKTFGINYNISDFETNNAFSLKSQHLVSLNKEDLKEYIFTKNHNINLLEYFNGRLFFDQLIYNTFIKQNEKIKLFYKNRSVKNNLFDFELSNRELTISTLVPNNYARPDLLSQWESSWKHKGFKTLIGEEEHIQDSELLTELEFDFLGNLVENRMISHQELFSFKKIIFVAELGVDEPIYFSEPFVINDSFETWEPDSIFHLMDKSAISFFSCTSEQASRLLKFLFSKRLKIKQTIQDQKFSFTLNNLVYLLFDDLKQAGWLRSTDLKTLGFDFISWKNETERPNLLVHQKNIQTI